MQAKSTSKARLGGVGDRADDTNSQLVEVKSCSTSATDGGAQDFETHRTSAQLLSSEFQLHPLAVCTHTHTHAHARTRTHAHTHTRTRTHARRHTRTHARPRARARTHTHTHTHTPTHTHSGRGAYPGLVFDLVSVLALAH